MGRKREWMRLMTTTISFYLQKPLYTTVLPPSSTSKFTAYNSDYSRLVGFRLHTYFPRCHLLLDFKLKPRTMYSFIHLFLTKRFLATNIKHKSNGQHSQSIKSFGLSDEIPKMSDIACTWISQDWMVSKIGYTCNEKKWQWVGRGEGFSWKLSNESVLVSGYHKGH